MTTENRTVRWHIMRWVTDKRMYGADDPRTAESYRKLLLARAVAKEEEATALRAEAEELAVAS